MGQGMVTGFSHVAFNVADMDRSLGFYCGALGLEKAFEILIPLDIAKKFPGHPVVALAGKPGIAYLKIGNGAFLELFYPKPDTDLSSGGPNFESIGYVHLSLLVDDVHAAADRLKGLGIALDSDISLGPDHTWQFWIKDPDGNRIELMQYTERSLQVTDGQG
jgi:catechol 2,3-dioxygenase-like lactoylglutathione lyase family enzyme